MSYIKSFAELCKPRQGFDQGKQWSLGAGHVRGVGLGIYNSNIDDMDMTCHLCKVKWITHMVGGIKKFRSNGVLEFKCQKGK